MMGLKDKGNDMDGVGTEVSTPTFFITAFLFLFLYCSIVSVHFTFILYFLFILFEKSGGYGKIKDRLFHNKDNDLSMRGNR